MAHGMKKQRKKRARRRRRARELRLRRYGRKWILDHAEIGIGGHRALLQELIEFRSPPEDGEDFGIGVAWKDDTLEALWFGFPPERKERMFAAQLQQTPPDMCDDPGRPSPFTRVETDDDGAVSWYGDGPLRAAVRGVEVDRAAEELMAGVPSIPVHRVGPGELGYHTEHVELAAPVVGELLTEREDDE